MGKGRMHIGALICQSRIHNRVFIICCLFPCSGISHFLQACFASPVATDVLLHPSSPAFLGPYLGVVCVFGCAGLVGTR